MHRRQTETFTASIQAISTRNRLTIGQVESAQGNLANGHGRTPRCFYRTRQVKTLHVVEGSDVLYMGVTFGSYPMPVDKQGMNVTVYSNQNKPADIPTII